MADNVVVKLDNNNMIRNQGPDSSGIARDSTAIERSHHYTLLLDAICAHHDIII
jgi:hypothetical protein